MSDVSQGPDWWQASDLKWYPPELHADYVPPRTPTLPPPPKLPPPPTPVTTTEPPVTPKGPSGQRNVWFVLAGLAVVAFAVVMVGCRVLPWPIAPFLLALLVMVATAIIGVTIAVRSGQSGARRVMFIVATVLVAVAVPAASFWSTTYAFPYLINHVFQRGNAGSSSNSSSFCADLKNLWYSEHGLQNALIAVKVGDESSSPPLGWSESDLQTAAKNAKTLAAEAPSDQLKTDFTNISDTLSAAATGDYTYHGTGNEGIDVSSLTGHCLVPGAPGH